MGTFLPFAVVGWYAHPVFAWVGSIFGAIASVIDAIPQALIQLLLAAVIIAIAANWIRRFLASFVTPAGGEIGRAQVGQAEATRACPPVI